MAARTTPGVYRKIPTQEGSAGAVAEATAQLGMYIIDFPIVKPISEAVFTSDQGYTEDGFKPEGPAEILLNFDQDPPVDQANGTNSPHTVTKNGGVLSNDATAAVFGSGGAVFDGTDDYFSLADSSSWDILDGDFFFEFTMTPDAFGAVSQVLLNHATDANNRWVLYLGAPGDPQPMTFQIIVGGVNVLVFPSGIIWTGEEEQVVAVERHGGTIYFYRNGEMVASTVYATTHNFAGPFVIGRDALSSANHYKGKMDNFVLMKTSGPRGQDYFVRDYPWEDFDNL